MRFNSPLRCDRLRVEAWADYEQLPDDAAGPLCDGTRLGAGSTPRRGAMQGCVARGRLTLHARRGKVVRNVRQCASVIPPEMVVMQRVDSNTPSALVVEDDPDMQHLETEVLSGAGYAVTVTESALGAMTLARHLNPDAIVLDLGLPYRSGASLLADLKADPDTAHIPVVVVSGMAETLPDRPRELATAVLPKPFYPEELVAAVRAGTDT